VEIALFINISARFCVAWLVRRFACELVCNRATVDSFSGGDRRSIVARSSGGTVFAARPERLGRRDRDTFCFRASFDQLPFAKSCSATRSTLQHAFDSESFKPYSGGLDQLLFSSAHILRRNLQNPVCIDQEFYLDARQSGRSGRNFQREAGE